MVLITQLFLILLEVLLGKIYNLKFNQNEKAIITITCNVYIVNI